MPNEATQTRRAGWMAPLPERGALSYLLSIFQEIGCVVSGDNGQIRALNWQDLAGYIAATKQDLEPWESKALIDLSIAYLNEHYKAKDPQAIAPY